MRAVCSLLMVVVPGLVGCEQRIERGRLAESAWFGYSTAASDSSLLIGAPNEPGGGAAYVESVAGERGVEARLVGSDTTGDDGFGHAVSLSGDVAAVAAVRANAPTAVRAGAVYVFRRSGGVWSQEAKLVPPLPQAWQAFGSSVSISGNDLIVGSVDRDQPGAVDAGAAYVYRRTAGVWGAPIQLAPPSPVAEDKFGSSVAIAGNRAYVGALYRNAPSTDCGAVFAYARTGGSLNLTQTLLATVRSASDAFGASIALSAGAAQHRLVIGAPRVDTAGIQDAGAAYVFSGPPAGPLTQTALLTAEDPALNASLGYSVAISAARIAVGAPGLALQRGAGFVFGESGGVWSQSHVLLPADAVADDANGSSVALVGTAGAAVGAIGVDGGPTSNVGAVHWFALSDSSAAELGRLSAAKGVPSDLFGSSVAMGGGWAALARANEVDLLRRDSQLWSLMQTVSIPEEYEVGSLAIGTEHVAVFGRRSAPGPLPLGILQIFARSASGVWALQQSLTPDLVSDALPHENANGVVLATSGNRLVLGAPRFNGGDGRVIVYQSSGETWTPVQVLESDIATLDFDMNFGRSVAIDGDRLVVAESPSSGLMAPPPAHYGEAHVYDFVGGSFTLSQTITAPVPASLDHFARGLALSGDLLAIAGEGTTLRVYTYSAGAFSETWGTSISGLSIRTQLAFYGERLAVGVPDANYSGLTSAGEVRVYLRQADATWTLERSVRPGTPANLARLGSKLAYGSGGLLAATLSSATQIGTVHAF
jgi:hypothetical protein